MPLMQDQFKYLRAADTAPAASLKIHYRSKDFMQIRQLIPTIYTWVAYHKSRVPRALQTKVLQTPHILRPHDALFPLLPSAARTPEGVALAKLLVAPAVSAACTVIRENSLLKVGRDSLEADAEAFTLPQALAVAVFGDRTVDVCGWIAREIRNRGDRYGRHLVLMGIPSGIPRLHRTFPWAGRPGLCTADSGWHCADGGG